ncbi:MAG TPA: nuclear transport factor 2 family protein [Pyrinomonadaceae bacterium]
MRQALILLSLIAAMPPLSFSQAISKERSRGKAVQEVKQSLRQIEEASLLMNKASLERLLADDFTFTNSVGVASTKREHIEAFGPDKFRLESVTTDEERVRLYGDTAVVTFSVRRQAQVGGRDVSGRYRGLMVLVKAGGRWQLVAQQETRVTQPRPQ